MKRIFRLLCFLTLFLVVYLGIGLANDLPGDGNLIFHERYNGWSGVVRAWVCEGWSPGKSSLTRWLNTCAATYERRNNGIYLYITDVPRDAILSIATGDFIPPDLVFFPPGLFQDDGFFISITNVINSSRLRNEFSSLPDTVLPVAMGGYCWAYDAGAMEFPSDLSALCAAAYPDADFHTWSAAALLSATYTFSPGDMHIEEQNADLDIGLTESPETTPTPEPTPSPQSGIKTFPGADFRFSDEILSDFCSDTPAVLISQRELCRLAELAAAPDYRVVRTGKYMLADQLYLAAVADTDRSAAAMDFLDFLLSEESQMRLSEIGCFSVTGDAGLYPPGSQLGMLEQSVAEAELIVPPAFSSYWRERAGELFERCRAGELDAFSAARLLMG